MKRFPYSNCAGQRDDTWVVAGFTSWTNKCCTLGIDHCIDNDTTVSVTNVNEVKVLLHGTLTAFFVHCMCINLRPRIETRSTTESSHWPKARSNSPCTPALVLPPQGAPMISMDGNFLTSYLKIYHSPCTGTPTTRCHHSHSAGTPQLSQDGW